MGGNGRALTVVKLIVGARSTAATGVELPRYYFDGTGMGQRTSFGAGLGKGGGVPGLQGQEVWGWDEWCEIGGCSWPRPVENFDGKSHAQERQW